VTLRDRFAMAACYAMLALCGAALFFPPAYWRAFQ